MSVPPARPPLFGETESIIGLGGLDELASIPRDDRQKTAIRNAKNQRMGDVIPGDRLPCASEQYAEVVRRARGFTLYVRALICV